MEDWTRRIREGDLRALARVATGLENRDPDALRVLRELSSQRGKAIVLGVTGSPGSGKSTLVDAIARVLRQEGSTVGIVAVDPSSHATGGAILGDRIRMTSHHADPGIFIRSMATRGSLGGLAQATRDLVSLLDAAGRDFIIVETVGVGQAEVEIAGLAQVTAVVLVPGMGDDIQAIKAGIMEIADLFVINKADQPGADRVEHEIQAMLGLAQRADRGNPPIVRTIATEGKGIADLVGLVRKVHTRVAASRPGAVERDAAAEQFRRALEWIDAALRTCAERVGMRVAARIESAADGAYRITLLVPDVDTALARLHSTGAQPFFDGMQLEVRKQEESLN